jgi:hypothetical protein
VSLPTLSRKAGQPSLVAHPGNVKIKLILRLKNYDRLAPPPQELQPRPTDIDQTPFG